MTFDSPNSVKSIPSFVETYDIKLDELLEPNIDSYKSFNEFFYRYSFFTLSHPPLQYLLDICFVLNSATFSFDRKLKPGIRPVENESDHLGLCSAADCRLTVYESVSLAKQFW